MQKLDFKTKAIAVGVVIGMLGGVGVMSANANTNPFSGTSSTSSASMTQGATTSTTSKVEDVKAASVGNTSTPAKQVATSDTTTTVSSNKHVHAADSTAKATDDVGEAAEGCAVANHAEEVQVARMKTIDAGPTRIQAMENIENNESTKGCLASSQEIIDLTVALPTIRGSWGDIGQVVRRQVDKELANIKEEVINRTCEIADKAVLDATSSVRGYFKTWNDAVAVINGADAMVGKYLSDRVSLGGSKVDMYLSERLNSAENSLNAANARAADRYKGYKSTLNEKVYDALGFEIGDAQSQVDTIRRDQIQTEIADIQRRIPPKPTHTVQTSGGLYYKCLGTSCQEINVTEYQKIRAEHQAHNNAVEQSRNQLAMLQKQLSEIGKQVTEPTTQTQTQATTTTSTTTPATTSGAAATTTQTQAQGGGGQATLGHKVDAVVNNTTNTVNTKVDEAQRKTFSISDLNPFNRAQSGGSGSESMTNNRF